LGGGEAQSIFGGGGGKGKFLLKDKNQGRKKIGVGKRHPFFVREEGGQHIMEQREVKGPRSAEVKGGGSGQETQKKQKSVFFHGPGRKIL